MATLEERKDSAGTWYTFDSYRYGCHLFVEPTVDGRWAVISAHAGIISTHDTLDEIRNTY